MSVAEIRELVASVLVAHGLSSSNADIISEVVSGAERDGTINSGLLRVPGYVATLKSGWVDGNATPVIEDIASGSLAVDARNGFAQIALSAARDELTRKARTAGIASAAIRNSHHFGALYSDVEPFSDEGFVAISLVNSRSRLVPSGGITKLFGTNPMAFACPRAGGLSVVFDQASSVLSQGEVLLAARDGKSLPDGVGLDAMGRPTNDPHAVLDGGSLLPFGGYKGSNIALMVELLAAAVTGAEFGFEDKSSAFAGAQSSRTGQLVIVIDPERLAGPRFRSRVEKLLLRISGNGVARIPGERRRLAREEANKNGVEVRQSVIEELQALLDEARH